MSHDNSTEIVQHGAGEHPERFDDPGVHQPNPRLGDLDEKAAKKAERQVAALFTVSIVGTIVFVWAYFALPPGETPESMRLSNVVLGLALTCILLGIGTAIIHWAKTLMSNKEYVEERHPQRSDDETRAGAIQALQDGAADSGISRRGALKGAGLTALALFPLSIVLPLIGNVGEDWNVSKFKHTMWRKGTRLAYDPTGRPIKASDLTIGSIAHVIPEDLHEAESPLDEKAKAVVLLVRMDPRDLRSEREPGFGFDGIVAYSKICTHVGCPVALYEQQTHHLLCPCHQSTFDVADGAKVVFGPAKRPLPQLPIEVDAEGYLVARGDFVEPVGPTFWERLT